jgi:adenylylsulfate kinase
MQTNNDISWHHLSVTRERREKQNGHRSALLWFTGLSGAGKSTLANAVEESLHRLRCRTMILDGDNVRHGLNKDLSFSDKDRSENIRRVGEMSKLFVEAGVITLAAFISPFRSDRRYVRRIMCEGDFIEIYCKCPIDVCETRDIKGIYKRARAGEILNFTGISSPYEEPEKPELVINTDSQSLDESAEAVVRFLKERGLTESH